MRMKNIVGIAAVVTVAIVLIVFSSTASAESYNRSYTDEGGVLWYEGELISSTKPKDAGNKSGFFEGEEIHFWNKTLNKSVAVTVSGPYESNGELYDEYAEDDADDGWDTEGKPTMGYFKVVDADEHGGWFTVRKHSLTVELVGEKEKVQEGESFNLTLKSNDREQGVMKLTIEDDEGYSIMNENGTDIYEILIEYKNETEFYDFADDPYQEPVGGIITKDKKLVFDTSELDMEEGEYKIILEDSATEAEDDIEIEVEKIYLKVECDDEVVKGEDIVIIIKSSFYEENVNVTVETIPETIPPLILDEEGKKKVKISTENANYGTHKVTVEVCGTTETKYVTIKKSSTSLEVPENATVGDIVHISGASESGDFAVFLVDDVFKTEARISDGEFEWAWDTSGEFEDYYEIEVFILSKDEYACFSANFSVGTFVDDEWQREGDVDASATISLFLPTFRMTVSDCIARGDDVAITGKTTGADHVYVIVINYKGEVMFPANGIAKTTPVEEDGWTENIGELDSGRYAVISMHEGRDGITDAINGGKWATGGEGKTLEQRVAILEDALSSAGSDDLFELVYSSVSMPEVSLEVPETVEVGDEITVNAVTNIKSGEKAIISLLQNFSSNVLKNASALVESGCVTASINTSGLQPGTYNVTVDIRGRASDEKGVILVEKKEQEESIPQNESLAELEAVAKANESAGEMNESHEGREGERIPLNVCDLLIAISVAISISIAVKRRSR